MLRARAKARRGPLTALVLLALGGLPAPGVAQTDYYNLDKGRPLRVEDAYTAKRWAFEATASPLTIRQDRAQTLHYSPSIELTWGVLPGVATSVGLEVDAANRGSDGWQSHSTVELSTLMNLWVEGRRLPAAGIRVTGHLPAGGDEDATGELRGILTRSLGGPVRVHLNGALLLGTEPGRTWWGGGAFDLVLPFHHLLLLGEGWFAPAPQGDAVLHTTVGARFQLTPTLLVDAGVGRGWRGEEADDWKLTFGVTREFALRSLMPGARSR